MTMRAAVALMLAGAVPAAGPAAEPAPQWVTAWASAQQVPDARNQLSADIAMLRQVVRVTAGGRRLRIRLSNALGEAPLVVTGVHLALSVGPGSAAIRAGSDRVVHFAGAPGVTVPAGADYWSDPVDLPVAAHDSVAVSMALTMPAGAQTIHSASHATSFAGRADQLGAADLPGAGRVEHWAFLSGIDVRAAQPGRGVVALGDSITDGSWSTTDGNDRWPDILSNRLRMTPVTRGVTVLNAGIGGNRVLEHGNGPNALARFDRDVLAQAGVRYVIVLEGINDIGVLTRGGSADAVEHDALVARIIAGYRQIVARAHRAGLRVYGGTLLPFGGTKTYRVDAATEGDRAAVNRWIRTAGVFDAVIDFDAMVRDPARPDRLLPAYDSGDHLHPSPAGYRRMGEGVPLTLFR